MKERKKELEYTGYSNKTEAIKDIEVELTEGKVPIPHEEAVEIAKEWVEENEK